MLTNGKTLKLYYIYYNYIILYYNCGNEHENAD